MNVAIPFFDDLDLLKGAVASVPEGITIYAIDGRYSTFPGEWALTPDAEAWCAEQPNVHYVKPPIGQRPWGADRPDANPVLRYDQFREATFINYDLLPADEWVLKLDADERIVSLDRGALPTLDRHQKYTPFIDAILEGSLYSKRLYVPKFWTFWIDDVSFPREFYSRDTPVEALAQAQWETKHSNANHGGILKPEVCSITNVGATRPLAYLLRRQKHLEAMQRSQRVTEYQEILDRRNGG